VTFNGVYATFNIEAKYTFRKLVLTSYIYPVEEFDLKEMVDNINSIAISYCKTNLSTYRWDRPQRYLLVTVITNSLKNLINISLVL
jgi:hypothetical protein